MTYKPSDTRPMQLAAIGSCLTGQRNLDTIMSVLNKEHFPDLLDVFEAVKEMHSMGSEVNAASLVAYLISEKGIGHEVVDEAAAASGVDPKVAIRALTVMRGRQEASKLGEYLVSPDAAKEGIDSIVTKINKFSLSFAKMVDEPVVPLSQFMAAVDQTGDRPRIILPGMGEIDKHYRIRPGTMNVVAAPPGIGKTALLLNMAVNAAYQGVPSLTISLEVPDFDLKARLTAIMAGVSAFRVKEKCLDPAEVQHVQAFAYNNAPLISRVNHIAPAKMQVDTVQAVINKWIASHGIGVVYIDYLQRLQAGGKSEYERVTYVSETLTQVAKITGIPIVCASSTRRKSADDKSDTSMHDLRSSGSIEFDAHTIAILSRQKENKNIMLLDLLKNRDGALWGATLFYDFETQRIYENAPTPFTP